MHTFKHATLFILTGLLLASCAQQPKEKWKRTRSHPSAMTYGEFPGTVKKEDQVAVEEINDFSNKGIGPIKSYTLEETTPEWVASGEQLFRSKCTACHKMGKKFIGPNLVGLTERRSPEWALNMMLNPEEMLEKDPIARQLLIEANGAPMANQNLSEMEAKQLLEFIRNYKK